MKQEKLGKELRCKNFAFQMYDGANESTIYALKQFCTKLFFIIIRKTKGTHNEDHIITKKLRDVKNSVSTKK